MSESPLVAPSLSTYQAEDAFAFHKYQEQNHNRSFYLGSDSGQSEDLCEHISSFYSVELLVDFFRQNPQYKRITLQFPDHLIMDSTLIVQLLQKALPNSSTNVLSAESQKDEGDPCSCNSKTPCSQVSEQPINRQIWVLADTAYSPCCVDEVACEHVNGDIVVHFGDACLNAVQRLPVLYCFGKPYTDLDKIVEKFQERYPDKETYVCLMADIPYSYHLKQLHSKLIDLGFANILSSDVNSKMLGAKATIIGKSADHSDEYLVHTLDNREIYSRTNLKIENDEYLQSTYELFHITMPDDPRLLFLTTKFKAVTVYHPDQNVLVQGPFPLMMRRYRSMHVARTASTIGILVNTLSLTNTRELLASLINLIRENGKKHYVFVVGKPNVAKLANFEAIDIWCILGCGQGGIIVDQANEFYRPIITPYELMLALQPEITWTGQWVVDFKNVLNQIDAASNTVPMDEGTSEEHMPEFDPVTGKYVSTSRPLRNIHHLNIEAPQEAADSKDSTALVKQFSGTMTIGSTVSTSAAYLQSRQWTGLGNDFKEDDDYEVDGATVVEGRTGVARGYQYDRTL
ncbi:2-(3-amino-3-carboxypropyl)histidine synthase Ecym_7013 [Eremothecium cymbalariae DBVPG|uniref:2-(3-amino-3-carboxypropyl)histidine synthase subunit 2 n=1 Tax=Eremothecium cymbalariae (strain CBS 270.75 / DBVPG 7215 / KCTC 17166 / NRRL Y-17582) TaxID=931890 RepID=G8JVK5_ERECY|nr:hypothetical protein Ecym_7013 [Eremothecium cymbalariae DBVPG\